MLSYPLFFALRDCFMGAAGNLQPMSRISSFLNQNNGSYHQHFRDVTLLATFVDKYVKLKFDIILWSFAIVLTQRVSQSHDNARFLNKQSNQQLYRNALTMVLFSVGIPMCVRIDRNSLCSSN
jgi:hypothetical protein